MYQPFDREPELRLPQPSVLARVLRWVWQQISYEPNRRLVIVFLVYILTILGFAKVYELLYRASRNAVPHPHFFFSANIVRTSNLQTRTTLEQRLMLLQRQLDVVSSLRKKLASLSSSPRPKPLPGSLLDYVEFEVEGYTCEFDLQPGWSYTDDFRIVKRNGLMIADRDGGRLLNREVEIVGPKDASPRPSEVQQWIDTTASGLDMNLYRQMTTKVLNDLTSEIARLNRALKSISDDTQPLWSYWDFVYFSTITQATVGYGDILPNSTPVRMIVVTQVIIGLILVVFALTFVFRRITKGGQ